MTRHLPFVLALALLACVLLPWSWSGHLGNTDGDNAVYLMTAEHYSPFIAADPVARHFAETSQFPPLYPLLLAITGAATGIHAAHVATIVFLLAGFAAYYAWLIRIGVRGAAACAATVVFAVLPGTWLLALSLQSEGLYLALAFAALVLLARARAEFRAGLTFWAGLVLAAALMCRTSAVALLPALAAAALWAPVRAVAIALVLAVLPTAVWSAVHDAEWSYADEIVRFYRGVESLPDWFAYNLAELGRGFVLDLGASAHPAGAWIALPIAVVALVARLRRNEPDAWYALAYLVLLVLWPFPSQAARFAWVLIPVVLGQMLWAVERFAERWPGTPWLRAALPAALVAAAFITTAPSLLNGWERWSHPAAAANPPLRHLASWYGPDPAAAATAATAETQLFDALREMGALVPEGECVFSISAPTVSFYMRRLSLEPPAQGVDDATFARELAARGCRYVALLLFKNAAFKNVVSTASYYPMDRLRGRFDILYAANVTLRNQRTTLAALAKLKE